MSSFFDKIGLADMEKVHSAVIGWMFSENCEALSLHQKSELLCKLFGVQTKTFQTIRVEVEHHDIDILILTDEKTPQAACWVIENKVKSSQHSNQLDKYVQIVNGEKVKIGRSEHALTDYQKYKNKLFCFLTLVDEASKCKVANWKNTTYKKLVDILDEMSLTQNTDGVILREYIQCIKTLADTLDEFLGNHQNYCNVFTDGAKKRTGKPNETETRKYIADNGLETIFQKCFLSVVNQKATKWKKYDFGISETHGVALIEYRIKEENGISYGVQFQNGSFKVQVLGIKDCQKDIKSFWDSWNKKLLILPLQKEWTINKSKGVKKPYFSISKSIGNKWYEKPIDEIAKLWDDMHGECEKIRNLLTNTQKP